MDSLDTLLTDDAGAGHDEPILAPGDGSAEFTPEAHGAMHRAFKDFLDKQQQTFWTDAEIQTHHDGPHLAAATPGVQHLLWYVMVFFRFADSVVAKHININMVEAVAPFYVKANYRFQAMMEDVHAVTYDRVFRALFPNRVDEALQLVQQAPVSHVVEWARARFAPGLPADEYVIAGVCMEGILFSSKFAAIYWLKNTSKFPALIQSNELISRDESMHTDLGCLVHSYIRDKAPAARAHEIVREAVGVETAFARAMLPTAMADLSAESMAEYIKFVADRLMVQLGYPKVYNACNPFPFMERISQTTKPNFFEQAATEYTTPPLTGALEELTRF